MALWCFQKYSYMRDELNRAILSLIEFGILDKLFKGPI
jgi:hypothetical protein